jgi:hypothetical protein
MTWRSLILLTLIPAMGAPSSASDAPLEVNIDILIKPEVSSGAGEYKRHYPKTPAMQRLVWEPWAKFHYRIKKTHILRGAEATEFLTFINDQINDKSPTGWVGHEAEYAITASQGATVILLATLSSESGSSVYVDGDQPVIGHFHPNKRIIALLTNEVRSEQAGTGQPATRSQLKSEGGDKPQPESEGRSR